jgi:hypothetical protein
VKPQAADTHSGMAELAFVQGTHCISADVPAGASAPIFISMPLSWADIRAECGAPAARIEAKANAKANTIRCQAMHYYMKTRGARQLDRRSTVSQTLDA